MVNRDLYLRKLLNYMWDGQIKVITGIRRAGKSTLLFGLFYDYLLKNGTSQNNIITLQLDKRKYAKYRNPIVLADFVESTVSAGKEKFYLFIDEIQFCYSVPDPDNNGFEITVYDMLNELKDYKKLDVYVTGSNSKMLSRDISTEFRGRSSQIHVFPLSFAEYNEAAGGDKRDNFDRYMIYGGLPYLLHLKTEEQFKDYLSNLFDEVYIKDIVERNKIERPDLLNDILNLLSTFISSLTNPLNITNSIKSVKNEKLSSNTVSDYIGYCKDAFLISEAKRYDVKGKHYFDYPNKYYFTDIGLRNARLEFRQIDSGHIMENIIYNELLVRGYSVDIGVVQDRRNGANAQKEIDFVVNKGDRRVYIQSAWQMSTTEKIAAELDSLKLAKDFFAKIIIQNDIPSHFSDNDGIIHCNLIEFLLHPELIPL
ncbi:ATP-binding protein [uncultured Treponema sp.]|uniref:ATP-binding protein n=1 Tax=uncultured Treponema sp. TaxID=162155 RepID=UPI0025DA1A92|nr:ATP-binding protein [uncultured Treponema sp.]